MSINFLLQILRLFYFDSLTDDELEMIYTYFTEIDDNTLIEYSYNCNVINYNCDLEIFLEVIQQTISIFEKREEYEKCVKLNERKQKAIEIINS